MITALLLWNDLLVLVHNKSNFDIANAEFSDFTSKLRKNEWS